jgi:RNase H-fold protein (predicted Holliday junction resolvase)
LFKLALPNLISGDGLSIHFAPLISNLFDINCLLQDERMISGNVQNLLLEENLDEEDTGSMLAGKYGCLSLHV